MYLFVFIFVILSVLGLYTELFSLQMANLASKQKVAAETMMFWHGAVSSFARDYRLSLSAAIPAGGCPITLNVASTCGLPIFKSGLIASKTYLPTDYNAAGDAELVYTTRIYQALNNDYYVLTFVNPDATKLGFTVEQTYKQMANAGFPVISYGSVMTGTCKGGGAGRWLATDEYIGNVQICYAVPVSLTAVQDGAIGIITNLGSQ